MKGACVRAHRWRSPPSGRFAGREQRLGHAPRRAGAERIAISGDVLDCDPSLLARDAERDGAASLERAQGDAYVEIGIRTCRDLGRIEVADPSQEVVDRVGGPRPPPLGQPLELELERADRVRVEQLAQLVGAEQLGQELAVQGQRLGAALCQRGVAFVEVRGHVIEHQALGER